MTKKTGKIVTFYSFKGGVGRTMALANVAFLAAMDGKRVLVMDWDLEAPGLAYYFRGMLNPTEANSIKEVGGVLNILWEWVRDIKNKKRTEELPPLLKKVSKGNVFEQYVRSLVNEKFLPQSGKLDYIGAGGKRIETLDGIKSYEDALAHFSWTRFYDVDAGGYILDAWRTWAKKNYDLILIDSRTGLADVAGICTMQMPDQVALCFIYNRQNIDGIANVSAAIRNARYESIELKAIPMRVQRSESSILSDAQAYAISALSKSGGFSPETIQEDLKSPISIADNVPFYEALAPILAQDALYDPLSLNYLKLTSQLLGKNMELPKIETEYIEEVRRRLQPRHATQEYLIKLQNAEPGRAISELSRFVESATDNQIDSNDLDDEYVATLIKVIFLISNELDDPFEIYELEVRTLNLLRSLYKTNSAKWSELLVTSLEKHIEFFSFTMEFEDEILLLDELDNYLSTDETNSNILKRIEYKRIIAHRYYEEEKYAQVSSILIDIQDLLEFAKTRVTNENKAFIETSEIDVLILIGDLELRKSKYNNALKAYLSAKNILPNQPQKNGSREIRRLAYDLHLKLTTLPEQFVNKSLAANHAIEAVKWMSGIRSSRHFLILSKAIINSENSTLAIEFCHVLNSKQEEIGISNFANISPATNNNLDPLLECIHKLIDMIKPHLNIKAKMALKYLVLIIISALKKLVRREVYNTKPQNKTLCSQIENIVFTLQDSALQPNDLKNLLDISLFFKSRSKSE